MWTKEANVGPHKTGGLASEPWCISLTVSMQTDPVVSEGSDIDQHGGFFFFFVRGGLKDIQMVWTA